MQTFVRTIFTLGIFLSIVTSDLGAHPAWGFVKRANGDFVFSDVLHNKGTIWRLTKEKKLVKWMTGVHSHFIFQDYHGSIWGTHHDYISSIDGNENSLWHLDGKGNMRTIIPPTRNPREFSGVNFVIDPNGHVVYNYDKQLYVRRQKELGKYTSMTFERIVSMQWHRGNIYIADTEFDGGSVFAVDQNGNVAQIASELLELQPENPPFPEPRFNLLFGLSIDHSENVYVANSGSRRISRIGRNGEIDHIYTSESPWYPVSAIAEGDDLYVLEVGYVPGTGNIGPRLIHSYGEIKEELTNVEDFQEEAPYKVTKPVSAQNINPWVMLLLGLMILGILLAFLRIILGK